MTKSPLKPAIILVEPSEEGNIGAAARAMANMGLDELVLVRPVAKIGPVAAARAVHAGHVLESARHTHSLAEALQPYRRIIGTTSARARELPVPLLTPRELPTALQKERPDTSTALVFGPEVSGLDNDQLARCGVVVRVPCALTQPTLNLAQAVLVVTYELYLARLAGLETAGEGSQPANAGQVEGLFDQILPLLTAIGFQRDDTFEGVTRDLRRLVARAGVSSRDVTILRGICRRARHALERR